jgi:antitoxin CptB
VAIEPADAVTVRRLTWACRRGMRELDVLLERFLREGYPNASTTERAAFEQLLQLQDPELARYLLAGAEPVNPQLRRIVELVSPRSR